jgi:trigger factor
VKSTVEALEGNKVKVSIEVEESEFDRNIDAAFKKIARDVRLPGFRPGKAPRRVLEARIGIEAARQQALNDAIPEYLSQAVREHDVDIVATPDVQLVSGEEGGTVRWDATVEVRPEITVAGYAGLRVELPTIEVSDDDIDPLVENERRRHAKLVDVDRVTQLGDFVTLDLEGTRDGEPVAGLNVEDWSYEIGRGWVAPGFDDQLLGLKKGEEVRFTATPNGTEEAADFHIKVIRVQEQELPDVTDEWVSEHLAEFESMDALACTTCACNKCARQWATKSPRHLQIWSMLRFLSQWLITTCSHACKTQLSSSVNRASRLISGCRPPVKTPSHLSRVCGNVPSSQ